MKAIVAALIIMSLLACGNMPSENKDRASAFAYSESMHKDTSSLKISFEGDKVKKPAPIDKLLKLKWIKLIETPDEHSNIPISRPLVKNGIVFPGMVSTHAFDAKSGKKIYYGAEKNYIKRVSQDSLLAFQENNFLTIQNIYTGDIVRKYRQKFYARFEEGPKILKSRLILTAEKDILKLINYENNDIIVEHQLNSLPNGNYLTTKNFIFFADRETLFFMNYDGTITDSLSLGKMDSKPVLDENTIYAFIDKLGVVAIDTDRRQIKWSHKADWLEGLFSVSSDTLFVNHGCLSALNKETGELLWTLDCQTNEVGFTYDQLVTFDNYFLGFLEGYDMIPILGAVDSEGNIAYLSWDDASIFDIEGEHRPELVHPEDNTSNLGPVMRLSDVYDNMIFGQYNNVLVGFEILGAKN